MAGKKDLLLNASQVRKTAHKTGCKLGAAGIQRLSNEVAANVESACKGAIQKKSKGVDMPVLK